MRVQQRADDALAGLEAWEQTSLADLRTELARGGDKALKQLDTFRSGALADLKELLGKIRAGGDEAAATAETAPAKAAAVPPAAAKPAQAVQTAQAKPAAKPGT